MNLLGRLDLIVLALMGLHSFALVVHAYIYLARARTIDVGSRRTLAVVLNNKVNSLKSIALTAPYLGLAGTCVGILSAFGPFAMAKSAVILMMATTIGSSLVPTIVAIPVAILATCSHNFLRTRIDSLEGQLLEGGAGRSGRFTGASRFPGTKQFSKFPTFGLIAAPALAVLITGYMTFASFHTPKGLAVELASTGCEFDGDDRLIVLRITERGKVFLNQDEEDWKVLTERLSEIYSMRKHRTLYLLADPGVPFQTVANAIDAVENALVRAEPQSVTSRQGKLDIKVRLVTPKAITATCLESVAVGSAQRVFK